jgi:hypothetical protein
LPFAEAEGGCIGSAARTFPSLIANHPAMILNAYAVLDGFITLLRFGLGILVVCFATSAWRKCGRATSPESRKAFEDRCYLVVLLAGLLLGLNLASWPLFYLLLQSYVKEWPGVVMCIYGVTQIGAGTHGISRFLPGLLKTLQITKPALVFASGSWFVLYLVNRRSPTAPLWQRILGIAVIMGLLAAVDSAIEAAYLIIPKKEEFLAAGCCAEAFDAGARATRFLPQALLGDNYHPYLYGLYWGINGGMILALMGSIWLLRRGRGLVWAVALLPGAVLCVLVNTVFLIEIAAPALLHLPFHHCPYDLLPKAPESVLGIALFVLGSFCVGWASILSWFGGGFQTRPYVRSLVVKVLSLGFFAYLNSLVIMTIELAMVS